MFTQKYKHQIKNNFAHLALNNCLYNMSWINLCKAL